MRSLLKTGLLVAAGVLAMGTAAFGGYRVVGPRGIGFYRPRIYGGYYRGLGYSGWPHAYGFYAGPYGYGLTVGPVLGPGYGLGYGGYGPPYGGIAYGAYGAPYGGSGYAPPGAPYPPGTPGASATPYRNGSPDPFANPPARTESNYPPPRQSTPDRPVPQRELPPPTRDPRPEQAPAQDNTARLTIIVPEKSEVWFNGTKTSQTGTRREFMTPPLTPGRDFNYTIKARWTEGDKPVEVTQTVQVRANTSQIIDLTKVAEASPPEK